MNFEAGRKVIIQDKKIKITKDGPYLIEGNIQLERETSVADVHGDPEKWEKGKSIEMTKGSCLCCCGNSKNKPFCDATHIQIGFKDENAKK